MVTARGFPGTVCSNTILEQNRSYYELTVVEAVGVFCVGVASTKFRDFDSFMTNATDKKIKNKEVKEQGRLSWGYMVPDAKKGDVIGCTFDLSGIRAVMRFYKNGKRIKGMDVEGIRGDVTPAVSVSDKCVLQVNFGGTQQKHRPAKFSAIIKTVSVL